jgi:hypothetical protein
VIFLTQFLEGRSNPFHAEKDQRKKSIRETAKILPHNYLTSTIARNPEPGRRGRRNPKERDEIAMLTLAMTGWVQADCFTEPALSKSNAFNDRRGESLSQATGNSLVKKTFDKPIVTK